MAAGARGAIEGAVLLGGRSRRMGRDKAGLVVAGVPCAERVARALAEVCDAVWLVGGEPPEAAPGRRVPDPAGPRCSLRGLVAALDACETEYLLVCATDLPLVTPTFLRALAAAPPADAVVPRDAAGLHPLCARYRVAALRGPAHARLAAGDTLSLRGLLDAVETHPLEGDALAAADPEGRALLNVNTREELRRAEAWLAASDGGRETGSG
ncbi:MAG TPA: molybdenum cofactor guanylyltransferase [Myxococcota bacterium]|nr:molybdenum cofactor guanylyltransferase [Myxococcota bacterium]